RACRPAMPAHARPWPRQGRGRASGTAVQGATSWRADRPPGKGGSSAPIMRSTLVDLYFLNNPRRSLQTRRGLHWAPDVGEEAVYVLGVECIGLAAELAADRGRSIHQRGFGLVTAQRDEHRLDPAARAG